MVGKARWALQAQKAGHAGTLDPLATGVLAIAFGEATKTVPYVTDALKAYRFTIRWGVATTTDDTEGEVVATSDTRPSREAIEAALPAFTGEIMQVPPKFSAVKVEGERAYDLARDGADVVLKARPLWVESLTLIAVPDADHAELEMVCGKGGYVRAIARDLGEALGCLGHVARLRRTWSGPFEASDGVSIEQLDAMRGDPEAAGRLHPVAVGLGGLPEVKVNALAVGNLRQGRAAQVVATDAEYGDEVWASHDGEPIAIGVYKAGMIHPSRVFVLD
jgi:tRNA pseudouridine55 synthase